MEPGKTYDISAWVKIDGDTPSIIKMTMQSAITGNNDSVYTQLDASADTADWVKLSRKYTFGFDEIPAVFRVYFEADEQDERSQAVLRLAKVAPVEGHPPNAELLACATQTGSSSTSVTASAAAVRWSASAESRCTPRTSECTELMS